MKECFLLFFVAHLARFFLSSACSTCSAAQSVSASCANLHLQNSGAVLSFVVHKIFNGKKFLTDFSLSF